MKIIKLILSILLLMAVLYATRNIISPGELLIDAMGIIVCIMIFLFIKHRLKPKSK